MSKQDTKWWEKEFDKKFRDPMVQYGWARGEHSSMSEGSVNAFISMVESEGGYIDNVSKDVIKDMNKIIESVGKREDINFIKTGDTVACGHCQPDKGFDLPEKYGHKCACNCHKKCEHEIGIVADSKVGIRAYCRKCGEEVVSTLGKCEHEISMVIEVPSTPDVEFLWAEMKRMGYDPNAKAMKNGIASSTPDSGWGEKIANLIHGVFQTQISDEVWYQDKSCEIKLTDCLKKAEGVLSEGVHSLLQQKEKDVEKIINKVIEKYKGDGYDHIVAVGAITALQEALSDIKRLFR